MELELGEAAPLERRGAHVRIDQEANDLFERRLAEARALSAACEGLARDKPDMSARIRISASQASGARAVICALAIFSLMAPDALALATVAGALALFSALLALRLTAAIVAPLARPPEPAPSIPDDDLPLMTYLVPLYREANVVASLMRAIEALDYPAARMETLLLVESDDEETIAALRWLRLPARFQMLPVPPSLPRTKPKALNYGLHFSRGEIVAVLDAEDRPDPAQPREAVAAFLAADKDLAVVQAPLLIHNRTDSWLAEQFAIEYAIQFRVWLPFLARIGWPLALGGTSNYFRRDRLLAAGGWDAWNVTEDADIGLRLARLAGRADMINSPTMEEAPIRMTHWMAQRTRWMKGHIQTWLVIMRNPAATLRDMGLWRFTGVVLTLGGSLAASLLHGPVLLWMLAGAVSPTIPVEGWHVGFLGAGYGSAVLAAYASRIGGLGPWAFLRMALYWPLMSIAMVLALWDLCRRPHYWAKTPHGISRKPG